MSSRLLLFGKGMRMTNSSEKKLVLVAAWSFVLLAVIQVSQQTLRAEDEQCPAESSEKHANMCQLRVELKGKIPLLERIPLVKYFTNPQQECSDCFVVTEGAQRIGVDFDLLPGHMVAFFPNGDRQVICTEQDCTACETANACVGAKCQAFASKCSTNGPCEGCKDGQDEAVAHAEQLTLECTELQRMCQAGHAERCTELVRLRVENAALHATREVQDALIESRMELFEHLLDLATTNARLEAEVDFLSKQNELRQQVLSLQSENEKLKAAAMLADERHEMHKRAMQVASENDRLKLRVAELEQQDSSAKKVARSSKRALGAKKATQLK
jgi:hypothetical protein